MAVTPNPLLDLDPGIGQVASTVRFEIVDRDLVVIGNVVPLAADSISVNTSGTAKRELTGFRLDPQTLRDIDPFSNRIKPSWILEDGTEWPLGVFVFTGSTLHRGTYVSTLDTTMTDQDAILDQGTRSTFGIGQRGWILPAVEDLLGEVRITNVVLPWGSQAIVADPVVWPAGESRLKILTDLSKLAGWLPPYFDNNGYLIVRVPPDVNHDPPDHVYSSTKSRVLRDTIVEHDDLLSAPNVYVVTCSGPSSGEITATAQVDASLPFSVQNRRFEVVEVERAQGINSTEQAQQMANTKAAAAGSGYKNVQFDGFADPRHDMFQTVEWDSEMYRETGWNLRLTPGGSHSHTLTQGGFDRAG